MECGLCSITNVFLPLMAELKWPPSCTASSFFQHSAQNAASTTLNSQIIVHHSSIQHLWKGTYRQLCLPSLLERLNPPVDFCFMCQIDDTLFLFTLFLERYDKCKGDKTRLNPPLTLPVTFDYNRATINSKGNSEDTATLTTLISAADLEFSLVNIDQKRTHKLRKVL